MHSRYVKLFSSFVFLMLAGLVSEAVHALQPNELAAPRIRHPLHNGAEIVEVFGVIEQAKVEVFAEQNGSQTLKGTNEHCWWHRCQIKVEPLQSGESIMAKQTVDGVTSDFTRTQLRLLVEDVPVDRAINNEKLKPPKIGSPLRECQWVIPVENVVPGARVDATEEGTEAQSAVAMTPITTARPIIRPNKQKDNYIRQNNNVKATQSLVYMETSDPATGTVKQKPKFSEIQKPRINPAGVIEGSRVLTVTNLWVGAAIKVIAQKTDGTRKTLVDAIAPWEETIFRVNPIEKDLAGCKDCVIPSLKLCEHTVTGSGVPVRSDFDPPVIPEPVCAGSFVVPVCRVQESTSVRILKRTPANAPDEQLSWQGPTILSATEMGVVTGAHQCSPVTLGDATVLADQDVIYARTEIDSLAGTPQPLFEESPEIKVESASSVAKVGIVGGTLCPQCAGRENLPIFISDDLSDKAGPLFIAAMCGAESVTVNVKRPDDIVVDSITLQQMPGRPGYFSGRIQWQKYLEKEILVTKKGVQKSHLDHHHGAYTAEFIVAGPQQTSRHTKRFRVTAHGCLDCKYWAFRDQCVEKINELRAADDVRAKEKDVGKLQTLARSAKHEDCADRDARSGFERGAHSAKCFGNRLQNDCRIRKDFQAALDDCLEITFMGSQKEKGCYQRHLNKDPAACYRLTEGTHCECQFGHYENMTDPTVKSVACGVHLLPNGGIYFVQDYFN